MAAAATARRWLARCYTNGAASKELIGFIGVGNMGAPMARNLLAKGRPLLVYDKVASSVDKLTSDGAKAASSPGEVASQCKTIVTMLPAGDHVRQAYTGPDGVFSALQPNSLLIDSSTIEASVAKEMAALAEEKGSVYIDAPVSGGVGAATKGALSFMVGGQESAYERAKPLLECMGGKMFHCGASGSGQAAKICNNMLLAITMIGTSEALQLAKNLGLDPALATQILSSSSGRCWSVDTYNPCPGVMEGVPSSNDYKGGFGTALMRKDLGLAQNAAVGTRTITPLGATCLQIYSLMCQHGYDEKDFSSVFKFIEQHK